MATNTNSNPDFSLNAKRLIVKTVEKVLGKNSNVNWVQPAIPRGGSSDESQGEFQHQAHVMVSNNQPGWGFQKMHGLP